MATGDEATGVCVCGVWCMCGVCVRAHVHVCVCVCGIRWDCKTCINAG